MARAVAALVLTCLLASVLVAAQVTIVICHHPGPVEDPFGTNAETITISINALPAHLSHGDTIGPCGSSPTPRPTPRPTPKPTPRPTPHPTPRPTSTPHPGETPRPSSDPSGSPDESPSVPPTDTS